MEAFRFVDGDPVIKDDFFPTIIEDELKGRKRRSNDEYASCTKCAVSLFNTEKKAANKIKLLSAKMRDGWPKRYIAKGILTEEDGLVSEVNEYGHFSFYEFVKANVYSKFKVVAYV